MPRRMLVLLILGLWLLSSLAAPLFIARSYASLDLSARLQGPSLGHPLGTDDLGRDVLARLCYGGRVSLGVVTASLFLALCLGSLVGLASGYLGGWCDRGTVFLTDVLLALPGILLAITILAYVGRGVVPLILALSCTAWVGYARLARSMALSLRQREYTQASLASGAGLPRVLFRHLLPNCAGLLAVQAAAGAASVLLAEAGLSFLGLGIQPPMPSWGEMLSTGCDYLLEAPHLALIPGAAIFLVVWALNTLGEEMAASFDPKGKSVALAV